MNTKHSVILFIRFLPAVVCPVFGLFYKDCYATRAYEHSLFHANYLTRTL